MPEKQIHLHPHNYYAASRPDWQRTRGYQYVRHGEFSKNFYKGFFNDRHLEAGNQIHFVKIAGRSAYRHDGNYKTHYTHFQQGRPWDSEETRPPDDKIQNIFSANNSTDKSVSFYQKGQGLSSEERSKVTVYMMTGGYESGLHFGRQSFDLSKPEDQRYTLINNPVSNVMDDRTLAKYQKNVIGFSCKINAAGSHDTSNVAVVSKVGLLYASFRDDGSPWLDVVGQQVKAKNNIFCLECTRKLSPHGYWDKPGSTGQERYLTYTIEKSDWDLCNTYKHFGRHGNSNRAWYHWVGVVIEWHQYGTGSIIKTKTGTMWDFTPIIADNWSSLSTGQTSSFVIPQNFHTLGECKAQAHVSNNYMGDVDDLKKSVSYVHSQY